MSEGTRDAAMAEANRLPDPQRRRSPRLGSPGAPRERETKMALGVKRSIAVRKIAPRKTAVPSGSDKENTPGRSQVPRETKASTPGSGRRGSAATSAPVFSPSNQTSSAGKRRRPAGVDSPSNPSSSAGKKRAQTPVFSPSNTSSSAGKKRHPAGVDSPSNTSSSAGKKRHPAGVDTPSHRSSSAGKKRPQAGVDSPSNTSSSAGKKRPQAGVDSPSNHSSSAGKKRPQAGADSPSNPSPSTGRRRQRQAAVPSPITASSPPASSRPADPQDSVWSQKVRRSYSRLSGDASLHSPGSRETLFGFEQLTTPEVVRSHRVELSRSTLDGSAGSFTSMLEADEGRPEPDPNIPGVAVVKERRRRQKVRQIDTAELEVLAAQMNAEFREAEEFELVVE